MSERVPINRPERRDKINEEADFQRVARLRHRALDVQRTLMEKISAELSPSAARPNFELIEQLEKKREELDALLGRIEQIDSLSEGEVISLEGLVGPYQV